MYLYTNAFISSYIYHLHTCAGVEVDGDRNILSGDSFPAGDILIRVALI
jgi:hypothetical protein